MSDVSPEPSTGAAPIRVPSKRCLSCGYALDGLPAGACPECGRGFDPAQSRSYSSKPPLVRWRLWLPPVLVAVVVLVLGIGLFVGSGQWGAATWFGLPIAAGTFLGYGVRTKWFFIPVLVATVVTSAITGLLALDISGIFCGLMLAVALLGPLTAGVLIGLMVRAILKRTRFSMAAYLPVILVAAAPVAVMLALGNPSPRIITVTTTRTVDAAPAVVWRHLVFYEDVPREPPLLLRLGLPRPLGTSGVPERVGDVSTCRYDTGTVRKLITELRPRERLAFEVIEQDIHFEHDVRLVDGAFTLRPDGAGGTRLELETRYEPRLGPRWMWGPVERLAVHAVHEHVIEGIEIAVRRDGAEVARGE